MQATSVHCQRFLLTGCDSGVYRATGYHPVPERAQIFLRALAAAGPQTIHEITSFSNARPEAALFALALAASPRFASPDTVSLALAALPSVAPKAQDLTTFATYAASLRGWGRGLRSAVSDWYTNQDVDELAAQILRRPAKNIPRHRALLRRAHPKSADPERNALFQWIANGGHTGHLASPDLLTASLRLVDGFTRIASAATEREAAQCIEDCRLQPPQVPRRWKSSPRVWEALFDHLTYRQMLRNLPAMTSSGLLARGSDYTALAVARIADRRRIRAAAIQPLRAIQAMRLYRTTAARPVESLFDALDEAFHLSLANVPPIGKRIVVAVDATGSMQGAPTLGMPEVPAALSAAALGLSFAHASGRHCVPLAFHRQARPLLRFDTKSHLTDALNEVRATPSRSDAVSVMQYAVDNRVQADGFAVLTDRIGQRDAAALFGAFDRYREKTNADAKLLLVTLAGGEPEVEFDAGSTLAISGMNTHHAWTAMSAFLS